ncbi:MAG: FtsW/RodA/SpoVE family cell cycle protein [Spirochaetales bacterium]|nr:FtsW/RodA/SpoVE family cell cycle protein [Spirochaetales bacterium]
MARTSYDDWNFMGEAQKEDIKVRSSRPARMQQITNQRNSFIFLCAVILLTFMGLVCVYTASFQTAVSNGLPHYYFLLRQGIYVAIGIALMVMVNVVPEIFLRVLSPVLFFTCIVLLGLDTALGKNLLMNPETVSILFISAVMYMSLYFSGRGNHIERIRQLIVPVLGCVIVMVMILLHRNFSYALMFLAMCVTMFAAGGVGLFGVILLLLYAAVPVVCIILSKSDRILAVARFLIPGLGSNPRTSDIMAIKSAIASGSWFGKGLGGGVFKLGLIPDIAGKNILACICEELGFWGVVMICLFFAFYAFVGYMAAKNIRRQNGYFSNLALGITTMVVWQFILNITWTLGYIPGDGLPMPFFSYGVNVIIMLFSSGIIYRITRAKMSTDESEKVMESIQDELMFPERYDFENT